MKFKYDYLNNRLWKLNGEYSSEIAEDSQFRNNFGTYGSDGFTLGEKEWITFTFSRFSLKVYYLKNSIAYQKTLDLPLSGEITFEFSEQDLINNHEK